MTAPRRPSPGRTGRCCARPKCVRQVHPCAAAAPWSPSSTPVCVLADGFVCPLLPPDLCRGRLLQATVGLLRDRRLGTCLDGGTDSPCAIMGFACCVI